MFRFEKKEESRKAEKYVLKNDLPKKVSDNMSEKEKMAQDMRKKIRMPRSKSYVSSIKNADTISKTDEQIIEGVAKLPAANYLVAVLAKCTFDDCEVHTIGKDGNILEHFEIGKTLPKELEEGYRLYRQYPDCACVEIYSEYCCVIMKNGETIFSE